MKEANGRNPSRHLENAINYIMNPEKTRQGELVGGINCFPKTAYERMKETKELYGKMDQRQGYHIIISFKPGETTPDEAIEIIEKFTREYAGNRFECVYAVHDDRDHVHGHIVFNSVSCMDGYKYRYEKGDWQRYMQPITNRLCEEYGLSQIELEREPEDKQKTMNYGEWNEKKNGAQNWSAIIRQDIDSIIEYCKDYDDFLNSLMAIGYEIKIGKHVAIRPDGKQRFVRLYKLGEAYTEEAIREKLKGKKDEGRRWKTVEFKQYVTNEKEPYIKKVNQFRYRKAKLTEYQKKRLHRLYCAGKLKYGYSRNNSWRYKKDIIRMQQLQEQVMYITKYRLKNKQELQTRLHEVKEREKELQEQYREMTEDRQQHEQAFAMVKYIESAEETDNTRKEYMKLLEEMGYRDIEKLKQHQEDLRKSISNVKAEQRKLRREEEIMKRIDEESKRKPERT